MRTTPKKATGILGEYKGSQAREVLITDKEWSQIRRQRDQEVTTGGYRADIESAEDELYGTADLDDGVPDLLDDRADLRN